jgi:hypothetical protein
MRLLKDNMPAREADGSVLAIHAHQEPIMGNECERKYLFPLMLRWHSARWLFGLMLFTVLVSGCSDATGITWHSYIHKPSGQIHYRLHLASYKRGLFFGSCGPATRSLQWEYHLELKGVGPRYSKEAIELEDGDRHPVPVDSGSILFDQGSNTATIEIAVLQHATVLQFAHNGTYRMQKEP